VRYKRFTVVLVRFRAFWGAIVQQFVQQFLEPEESFSRLQIGCSQCAAQSCVAAHSTDDLSGSRKCPANDTQFPVAPPQRRLCFLPEPQGHGSFRQPWDRCGWLRWKGSFSKWLLASVWLIKFFRFSRDD
jgi:hypothetical protein